jgi:hypothetical protein
MNPWGGNTLWGLIVLALDIWAIINIVQSSVDNVKKVLWILLVLILPVVGFIIWLVIGPRGTKPVV